MTERCYLSLIRIELFHTHASQAALAATWLRPSSSPGLLRASLLIIRAFRFSLAARGEIACRAKVVLAGTFHQVSSAGQSSPSGVRGPDAIFRPLSADSVALLDLPLLSERQSQTTTVRRGRPFSSKCRKRTQEVCISSRLPRFFRAKHRRRRFLLISMLSRVLQRVRRPR